MIRLQQHRNSEAPPPRLLRVVELFAGVGGFHVALEGVSFRGTNWKNNGFKIVWANQWEPPGTASKQFAYRCYLERFADKLPAKNIVNQDIAVVLDEVEAGKRKLPPCDMLVGGFPCQDYSVARPLSHARGIEGKKGVLWWEIYRMLTLYGKNKPRYLLLENVDRMLKSPASQRGRDFAIMLSCLARLGYSVEWRVVNAADYGFPQRRRRVFIYGELTDADWDLRDRLISSGVEAKALPVKKHSTQCFEFDINDDPYAVSSRFGHGSSTSPFRNAGVMQDYHVLTAAVEPDFNGKQQTLADVLFPEDEVPEEFFLDSHEISKWMYCKGAKSEARTNKSTGFSYHYTEGGMSFPDPADLPSRTILTSEGGRSATRSKHVVDTPSGRLRRLIPDELDQLSGFPKGWTNTGMSDINRAFCIGNALVVGVVRRIGIEIAKRAQQVS